MMNEFLLKTAGLFVTHPIFASGVLRDAAGSLLHSWMEDGNVLLDGHKQHLRTPNGCIKTAERAAADAQGKQDGAPDGRK